MLSTGLGFRRGYGVKKRAKRFIGWLKASLRREFWAWIIGGGLVFVLFPLAARQSLCQPENVHWTVEGHRRATQGKYETAEESYFIAEKKKAQGKAENADESNYQWPCSEPKATDLLLVYFTYALAIVGWFTMRSADDNVRRTERAYIFGGGPYGPRKPKGSVFPRFLKGDPDPMFNDPANFGEPKCMTVQNYGKTNGFITRVQWALCPIDEFPRGKDKLVSKIIEEWTSRPPSFLRPNSKIEDVEAVEYMVQPTINPPWAPYRLVTFRRSDYVDHVFFARIDYRDVFGQNHYSTFKVHLTKAGFSDPIDGGYADHN